MRIFAVFTDSLYEQHYETRKHSSRMRTDRAVTRPSSEPVGMRPIVDRQTPVKTLPSLAVGNKKETPIDIALHSFPYSVNEP